MTAAFFPFVRAAAKEGSGGGWGVAEVEEEDVPLFGGSKDDSGKPEEGVVVVPCFEAE